MVTSRAMLLLVLSVLLLAGQGTLAKKGKAETINSNFQPGEGGIAERTGARNRLPMVIYISLTLLDFL